MLLASTGLKFILIIQFAQIANGILLPIIATILLWIMNKASWLGKSKNNWYQNLFGFLIVIISLFLSVRNTGFSISIFLMDIKFNINADVGEGMGDDTGLMPLIQACNIACGGHSGNQLEIKNTIETCSKTSGSYRCSSLLSRPN